MSKKLEWDELWDAMKADPSQWVETTRGMYWNQLEVVPPREQTQDAFLVGEPHHVNDNGKYVYACFREHKARFFARYMTVEEFESEQS